MAPRSDQNIRIAHTTGGATGRRLLLLVMGLLLLAACEAPASASPSGQRNTIATPSLPAKWNGVNPGSGVPTVTPPASLTPRPLPAFSDPRVAYIGPDSLLHVVSLDGSTDLAGTPIPLSGFYQQEPIYAAGASPDGTSLAYYEGSRLTIVDAASGVRSISGILHEYGSPPYWSPDGRHLVIRGMGDALCINTANLTTFYTPQDTSASGKPPTMDGPDGWIDATHIAVETFPDRSGTPGTHGLATPAPASGTLMTLESLDINTNQLRPITTLRGYGYYGNFSVLPGGQWTLFVDEQDTQARITPFTPLAALINNATGAVTPLPHLTPLLANHSLTGVLWRPNSTQALVTGEFGSEQSYLLIDTLDDTATPVALSGFPLAWSPNGATLVIGTGWQGDGVGLNDTGVVGDGPYALFAVRIGADGTVSRGVRLTRGAMHIPMLGFVHTA